MLSLAVYDLQQTRLIPNRPRLNSYEEVKSEEQEDCEVPGMDESKDMYAWRRLRNQVRHEEPYSSQQERLQRMETEFLESNYFVRRDPQPLADATINTSGKSTLEPCIVVLGCSVCCFPLFPYFYFAKSRSFVAGILL